MYTITTNNLDNAIEQVLASDKAYGKTFTIKSAEGFTVGTWLNYKALSYDVKAHHATLESLRAVTEFQIAISVDSYGLPRVLVNNTGARGVYSATNKALQVIAKAIYESHKMQIVKAFDAAMLDTDYRDRYIKESLASVKSNMSFGARFGVSTEQAQARIAELEAMQANAPAPEVLEPIDAIGKIIESGRDRKPTPADRYYTINLALKDDPTIDHYSYMLDIRAGSRSEAQFIARKACRLYSKHIGKQAIFKIIK